MAESFESTCIPLLGLPIHKLTMVPNPVSTTFTAVSKGQKRTGDSLPSSSDTHNVDRGRAHKRVKIYDARTILSQNKDTALKDGELDLNAFLKAREFEIKALEDGMQRSKGNLMERAFQSVPRDMRRRTASHNVKRVPKRLQNRAKREMKGDNTPTVDKSKRQPRTTRGRLRAETAKRLGILAAKKLANKSKDGDAVKNMDVRAARPKIRKDKLNGPPKPVSKFRKRQIHKTWLPTHMWHAKRARMTEPKIPFWRFALPITCTEKSYRPTHRASGARGAIAWDMSYMGTIALEGPNESLEKVLRSVGVSETNLWDQKGELWRNGKRSWVGWLSRKSGDECVQIGPSTVIWCTSESRSANEAAAPKNEPLHRIFVRVHPAMFLETWDELLRLSKIQRPKVHIEDLRFEIGSISVTGPGSTETLLGILHPLQQCLDATAGSDTQHAETFKSLAGVTNPASLPANAILSFLVMDPRLRYPSRKITLPKPDDEDANFKLLEMLATWPVDKSNPSSGLFDRNIRFKATRLPAQKAINRRKGLAAPGDHPSSLPTDPQIPVMLVASRAASSSSAQGTWTLLAPWKCILPFWYGLVHHPLTSGGNPRFGGLDELRQTYFEQGIPWFPADYPGTDAGFAWEIEKREERKAKWNKRPKGKRIEWDSLNLGAGRKGEIGRGCACDFERLIGIEAMPLEENSPNPTDSIPKLSTQVDEGKSNSKTDTPATPVEPKKVVSPIHQISKKAFSTLLSSPTATAPPSTHVANIRLTLTSRGVASPCARIYRLPSSCPSENSTLSTDQSSTPPSTTREAWLALLPSPNSQHPSSQSTKPQTKIPRNIPLPERTRLLAQSLLQAPPLTDGTEGDDHPNVPDEEDLIGFVTTGEFNLADGKGVAIGTVVVGKVLEGLKNGKGKRQAKLCIVRNAGETVGRLARWEIA
jgi:ribonuclease P/MRP protein subunit POP1